MSVEKPTFVSKFEQKIRPSIKIVSLSGKGDPMLTFDQKVAKISSWLDTRGIVRSGPILGIYYNNRTEVGVENVEWDACIPIDNKVEIEGDLKYQELPRARVVSVVLTGDYGLIGPALKWMESEATAKGIKTKWPLTEVYLREGSEPITELQYFETKG